MRKFQHYKGGIYEYLSEAIHSETEEVLVIYKNDSGQIFARPKQMFFENITIDGHTVPRFKEL